MEKMKKEDLVDYLNGLQEIILDNVQPTTTPKEVLMGLQCYCCDYRKRLNNPIETNELKAVSCSIKSDSIADLQLFIEEKDLDTDSYGLYVSKNIVVLLFNEEKKPVLNNTSLIVTEEDIEILFLLGHRIKQLSKQYESDVIVWLFLYCQNDHFRYTYSI